jgi:hypothetical protein
MDSCVRCLRDGGADAASVVLLLDQVEGCAGGDAVFEQVLYLQIMRDRLRLVAVSRDAC